MQIKLDLAAAVKQHISTPDSALLSYPNGPWGRGIDTSIVGDTSGANPQYIFSNGGLVSGSVNLVFATHADVDPAVRGKVILYTGSSTTPKITSVSTFAQGATPFLWLQREPGDLCVLYSCTPLTTDPTDGSAVVTEGSFSMAIGYDGPTAFYIGARGDLSTNRMSAQAFGRLLMINGRALTKHEIAKLAYGMSLSDLGLVPLMQAAPTAQGSYVDTGPNAFPFTVAGTPTLIAGPTFGYNSTPPPPSDTLTATALVAESGYQRIGTSAVVQMSGAWTGVKPTSVEYQLRSEDGAAILKAWTAIGGATINDDGTWSGAPAIPQGGMYRRELRAKNGTTVIASVALESQLFGVGDFWLYGGSSSAEKMFDSTGGTGLAPAANVRKFNENGFAKFGTVGAAITVANALAAQSGVPIFMMDYGIGGTTLAQWLDTTGAQWSPVVAGVAAVRGKIAGAIFTVGSNDAGSNLVVSMAQHLSNLRQLVGNTRALTGQADLHLCLTGFNRRGSTNTAVNANQANWVRTAENILGDDPYVTHIQTMDLPLSGDYTHLTASGFVQKGARIGAVLGRRVYGDGVYMRGPLLSAVTWTGRTIRGAITHRNGTDFTPTTGLPFFTASDDSGALTITVDRSAANEIVGTADRDIVGMLNFDYMSGGNPGSGTQVMDNGTPSLPMMAETALIATAEATGVVASPAGVAATAGLGEIVVAAGASATPFGVSAHAQVGTVSASAGGGVTAAPTGVGAFAIVGQVATTGGARGIALGVGAAAAASQAAVRAGAKCAPPGITALASVGVVMATGVVRIDYARAPAGPGYTPKRDERQSRPRAIENGFR